MSKRVLLVMSAVVVIVVTILIVRNYFYQETLKSVALKLLNAVEHKDGSTLWKYMIDDEKQLLNTDVKNLQMFLDRFVSVQFNGFQRAGEIQELAFEGQQSLMLIQKYRHPDGREIDLSINTVLTEDGVKAQFLTKELFICSLFSYWPADKPLPRGKEKFEFMANATVQAISKLNDSGLSGFVYPMEKNKKIFLTWQQFIDRMNSISEQSSQVSHQ